MELNINFKKEYEEIINANQQLADRFERNQETMAYFELTHPGCLHFENSRANPDNIVLGRIANAGLTTLENIIGFPISNENKAFFVALTIAVEYEKNKESLSDTAQQLFYLDMEAACQNETHRRNK